MAKAAWIVFQAAFAVYSPFIRRLLHVRKRSDAQFYR